MMGIDAMAPLGAQYHWCGSYYKIGRHGHLYRYMAGEWVRSTNSIAGITAKARRLD